MGKRRHCRRFLQKGDFMELYIHIPFCARKCAYCDFLSFADREDRQQEYGRALIRDISSRGGILFREEKPRTETVFIGGGTPSLMPQGFYERLFDCVRENFSLSPDAEITIECNPGTVNREKLAEYRRCGINRISFGVQSMNDCELSLLGRIHTRDEAVQSFRAAREAGFENINIDLMMNLPGRQWNDFERTLSETIALAPEHISAYSLIIEPGTPFFSKYDGNPELLPTEDETCRTYENAVRMLADAGYRQYEISNFARDGRECRHNKGYWTREEYLGIGLGAASLIGERRLSVTRDFEDYLRGLRYDSDATLTENDILEETVMLSLRTSDGLDLHCLEERFGIECRSRIEEKIADYTRLGLMERQGDRAFFTVRGFLVSNPVIAGLIM